MLIHIIRIKCSKHNFIGSYVHRVCPDFTPETCSMRTRVKQLIAVVAIRKQFVWLFFTLSIFIQFFTLSNQTRIQHPCINAWRLLGKWIRKNNVFKKFIKKIEFISSFKISNVISNFIVAIIFFTYCYCYFKIFILKFATRITSFVLFRICTS